MENLKIEGTQYTPDINMDINGEISMTGKSYPENTFEFYEPVMEWLEEYFEAHAKSNTIVNMDINYFNSSSSKLFFDLFDLLEENSEKYNIEVNWIYDEEDESSLEAGEDFVDDFDTLHINLVSR